MILRGAIFDFDGLILDTERVEFEVWRDIYRDHGADLDFAAWSVSVGAWDAFSPTRNLEELTGRKLDRDSLRARFRERSAAILASLDVLPGVRERLREAAGLGMKLAVASSSRNDWVEGHLKRRGLHGAFDAFACGSDTLRGKPAPDVFLEALRKLGLGAGEAVALEDSPNGIAGAKTAGLYCVVVPNWVTRQMDVSRADLRVDDLNSLSFAELDGTLENGGRGAG